jgi:hypothetical protein
MIYALCLDKSSLKNCYFSSALVLQWCCTAAFLKVDVGCLHPWYLFTINLSWSIDSSWYLAANLEIIGPDCASRRRGTGAELLMGWVAPWPAPRFINFIFYSYNYNFFVYQIIIYIIIYVNWTIGWCSPMVEDLAPAY